MEQILARERERQLLCGEMAAGFEVTEEGEVLSDMWVFPQR
jgi:hypothetical protein